MRKILLLLLILVFPAGILKAQQKQVHQLISQLSKATSDSARVTIYCTLSSHYLMLDQLKAIAYGQKAVQEATAGSHLPGKTRALHTLGVAYLTIPDYEKAIGAHSKALQISAQADDAAGIIQSYIHLGNAYFKAADHKKAIEHYLAASGYALKTNDKQGLSKIYTLAGSVHENTGHYKEALNYYLKAAGIKEKLGDKQEWAVSLVHIGMVYIQMGQPEKALPAMMQALQLESELNSHTSKIDILRSIAAAYKAMYNHGAAIKYAAQSYEMAEAAKNSTEIAASAKLLKAIYTDMNDFRQAYKYQAISADQEAVLEEGRVKEKLEILADAHQAEKKELVAARQQAENEKQAMAAKQELHTWILGVLSAASLIALLLVYLAFKRRLKATQWELNDALQQLQALNYKIQIQSAELEQQSLAFQEQNNELERHNHFKNKIFSVISHDLRSPFASVKGVLNLVQNKPMSETGIKYLFGLLGKDLDVTLNMLNNLLVWSKAQLENSDIDFQPIDMHLLVQENIQLVSSQANHKKIYITNQVPTDVLVLADRERVNFVIRNLIMNALKFTFEGGEIAVTAQELGETITVAVADDGRGISEENRSRLFTEERFTTIGTSSEKGTGLGLMLCKEFVESMNGRIGVESAEGKGSTFYFTLQQAAPQTTENEEEPKLMLA